MWILTVVLAMASGSYQPVFIAEPNKYECYVDAHRAQALNKQGLHVLATSCSRAKVG